MLPASPAQQLSTKSWVLYSCAHVAPGSAIASHSASVLSSPGSSCWASCCPPRRLPQALHLSMPYWSPLTFLSNVKVITGIKATQCWWRRCQTHRVLHSMDPEPSVLGEAQNGWVGRVLKGHRSTGWVGRSPHPPAIGWVSPISTGCPEPHPQPRAPAGMGSTAAVWALCGSVSHHPSRGTHTPTGAPQPLLVRAAVVEWGTLQF